MSNLRVTLAHHMSAADAARLGLAEEDLQPGTELVAPEDVVRGLIGAGYAAVDVEDPKAVAAALRRHAPKDAPIGVFQEAEPSGQPDPGVTIAEQGSTNAAPGEGVAAASQRTGAKTTKAAEDKKG